MKKNKKTMTVKSYSQLVSDIRKLIEEGKLRAQMAAGKELTQAYWKVGKRILNEELAESSGYLTNILEDISDELTIDITTLHRCIYFVQTYPKIVQIPELSWSNCKLLLPIAQAEKRKFYEDLATQDNLSQRDLSNAIKKGKYEESSQSKKKKTASKLVRPSEATYVYKAVVDKVIDGDTILVKLDLGFQVWRNQRLRFASIDAPAMDEEGGQKAFHFVRDQLAKVDFVMVKTNKIDLYGRYVGHVFYSANEKDKAKIFSNGRYLNQELLNRNLAVVY